MFDEIRKNLYRIKKNDSQFTEKANMRVVCDRRRTLKQVYAQESMKLRVNFIILVILQHVSNGK